MYAAGLGPIPNPVARPHEACMRIAIDLDGVMWRGLEPIPKAALAISEMIERGYEVVFCTNHASSPRLKRAVLDRHDVPDAPVVTSGEAALWCCRSGERVLLLGDSSLVELFEESDLDVILAHEHDQETPAPTVATVVVGSTPHWDRLEVAIVADALRNGARFLATNDDTTFPTTSPYGTRLLPGAGALVAAVAATADRTPEVTGKPYMPMIELLEDRYGAFDVVIGDRPDTDGALAKGLGAEFLLVLSGVTNANDAGQHVAFDDIYSALTWHGFE